MSEDNTDKKQVALSAKSEWLSDYSMLMSNGFERKIVKCWERDGLTFKTNKEAIKHMEELMEGN